ncbi:MAG TPA: GMC family oxidoreductase N-terminal domain-containing protein, partial [Herpetosiphonaceae bacterium]
MATTSSMSVTAPERRIAGWLSESEFATLEAICDTLLPSLEPPPGSSEATARYYRRSARDLQVAQRLAEMLARENPEVHTDLRQFLSMFTSRGPSMLFAGRAQPFAALPQPKREQYLLALANSPVAKLRKGYQGIKRLACLIFYSAVDASGVNPNWEMLDYAPPSPPPAVPPRITPLAITADTTLEADVVVLGSGAGGGVVAAELAQAGKSVIVLEKGGYNHEGNFTHLEQQAMSELFLKQGALASKDLGVLIMAGSTLGGGTVINWMTCFRTPADVLKEWEQISGLRGCFTDPELQRSFAAVEQRLRINPDNSQHNRPNQVLFDGAAALGYHAGVIHRNAVGCDQRCDGCNFGCRLGCSQSTMNTYLQDAYDHGARIVVRCSADRVLIEHGRAVGVAAHVHDPQAGTSHSVTVRATTVVVAAGALHSPAILLRSGLNNPHIGKH